MIMKLNVVLWNNYPESAFWFLKFSELKNLLVVVVHFRSKREWRDVDDINLWVFHTKYSCNLRIFSVFELLHRFSFPFINRKTIDVNFYSSFVFNFRPFLLELLHHDSPFLHTFCVKFFYLLSSVLLKLIKPVLSLYNCSFCH